MIALAWVISLIAAALLGYHYNTLGERLADLAERTVMPKPAKPEPPKSAMLDGDDPELVARYEFEERMRKLNPQSYSDDPEN